MVAAQAPRDFVKLIRARSGHLGITTADTYLREFEDCLDGACPSNILSGLTKQGWSRMMKRASRTLVYDGDGLDLGETIRVKEGLTQGLVLPPRTIATVPVIVTTPDRDRDGDILETAGADLDLKSAHLFNHLSSEVIGRVLQELVHTNKVLKALLSLMDTEFAENVATMYEHGSLRTSHGFLPEEWEALEDRQGFHITKFAIVEVSGVSIPSNPKAGPSGAIEFSRNKLTHPLLKEWGRMKFRARPAQGIGIDLPQKQPCGCKAHKLDTPRQMAAQGPREQNPARWNPTLSKHFDIPSQELEPASMIYDWASKFLEVPVKKIFYTSTFIPSTRMGSFLSAWQQETGGYELEDVRNVGHGTERPPVYDMVQLNSTKSADFLVDGTAFYRGEQDFIARFSPEFRGLSLDLYFAYDDRQEASALIDKTWRTAKEQFSFLKGECFALSGQFLPRTSETWDDLFLAPKNKNTLERTVKLINEKQEKFANRGVVLLGPPGTGKTLGGRIIRNQAKATFIWLSARDFYYSGAFGCLTYAFDLAKELAPSIIFIEDVDNWMGDTTVDLLKTEMDGIGRSAGILTILTTNYPERFPDALIDRPGRFHDVLKLDLPDKTARGQMLAKWVGSIPDETRDAILDATKGWSGAHMYELAQFAKVLQEQDDLGLPDSLTKAIDKITEQRDLISEALLGGSHFRPRKELVDLKSKPGLWHKSDTQTTEGQEMTVEQKATVTAGHVTKLSKAMDHLQGVVDHDDATGKITKLAKSAHAAVKSVHDAHDKGIFTSANKKSLEKAMGYCSTGAEHDDATAPITKCFKSAGRCIKDVMDDAGSMGEASTEATDKTAPTAEQTTAPSEPAPKTADPENKGINIGPAEVRKIKSAAYHFKAIEHHDEAGNEHVELARKGYQPLQDMLGQLDSEPADDAYQEGQGEPASSDKAAKLGKEGSGKITTAIEYGEKLAGHKSASKHIKSMASHAVDHLKAIVKPNDTAGAAGENGLVGTEGTNGNPPKTAEAETKTFDERCEALYDEAEANRASDDGDALVTLAAVGSRAGKLAQKHFQRQADSSGK